MSMNKLPKISKVSIIGNYILQVSFDDGKTVIYDIQEDIDTIPAYKDMVLKESLFRHYRIDESRTIIVWNDVFDLASDIIYKYGRPV